MVKTMVSCNFSLKPIQSSIFVAEIIPFFSTCFRQIPPCVGEIPLLLGQIQLLGSDMKFHSQIQSNTVIYNHIYIYTVYIYILYMVEHAQISKNVVDIFFFVYL